MKLLCLPGLDGTGQLFAPFIASLPSHFDPEIISYPADEILSYEQLKQRVISKFPTKEPFVIVAESFSGPLAVEICASKPPKLKALVLCASFLTCPIAFSKRLSFLVRSPFFSIRPPRFLITRFLLGPNPAHELIESLTSAISSVSPKVLASRLRDVIEANAITAWTACSLPTLYIRAQHDRLVGQNSLSQMLTARPEIQVVEIVGPHLLLQREPKRCADAIERFLGV